ncbi:hypothetical protein CBER1_08603 [Cercospora berteroae]|uniref:Uncharacterized protein n=1 Tax=Cercospora berteroae TaxID=357750 RepID=A0A2S6BV29_9PEZI|nr:hypothetical protein CBER1_08603 [Cercospora berteroae]
MTPLPLPGDTSPNLTYTEAKARLYLLPCTILLFFVYSALTFTTKQLLLDYRDKLLRDGYWSPTFHFRPKPFERVPIKFRGRPRTYCTIQPEEIPDQTEGFMPKDWRIYVLGWVAFVLLTGILFGYGEISLEKDATMRFLLAESVAVVAMMLWDAVVLAGMWIWCEKFEEIVGVVGEGEGASFDCLSNKSVEHGGEEGLQEM